MLGFNALSSSPISAVETLVQIQGALNCAATTQVTLELTKDLSQSLLVSASATPLLTLNLPVDSQVGASVTAQPNLTLNNQLATNIFADILSSATILLGNNSAANLSVTATASPNLTLENNSSASLSVSANASPLLTQLQPISANISVSAISEPDTVNVTRDLFGSLNAEANLVSFSNLDNSLQSTLLVDQLMTGLLDVNKQLVSQISTSFSVTGLLGVSKNLSVSVDSVATTNSILDQTVVISASVVASATAAVDLDVVVNLTSGVSASVASTANVTTTKNLSGSLLVTAGINFGTTVSCDVFVSVLCAALLDVDDNTDGSVGGFATEGFSPPSSVVLAQHVESADAATYAITADFGAGVETEIMSVSFNDNPANVLSYLVSGNQAFITANTPADVYAQASTFVVNRELVPVFNTAYNYKVRFNTAVKKDLSGNNFYSGKFYSEGNTLCFLSDDGRGIVDLYEELAPGTVVKLKSVGIIDYSTGYVQVEQLVITSKYDPKLFFFVESLDAVIPTQDYFDQQNNLLVQSKTLTFPTGEQVEITQYEKQTDIVDLEIYVTARSYAAGTPLVTIEERTATYILRIVPDYDTGKAAILQLLAEQA